MRRLAKDETRKTRRCRRAQSLLEVIAASTIVATALVPALRMMRASLRVSREIETAGAMAALCVSKLEEEMAKTSATWSRNDETGNFSSVGRGDLLYVVTKSDDAAAGGITDALMAISVTVWLDENGNGNRDGDEPGVTYGSKICKLQSYEDQAS